MIHFKDLLSQRSIKAEIALGFAALLFIFLLLALIGWNSLERLSRGVAESENLNLWVNSLIKLRRYEREYKLSLDNEQLHLMRSEISRLQNKIIAARQESAQFHDEGLLDRILEVTNRYQESFVRYVEQQRLLAEQQRRWDEVMSHLQLNASALAAINSEQYHQLNQSMEEHWSAFLTDLDELAQLERLSRELGRIVLDHQTGRGNQQTRVEALRQALTSRLRQLVRTASEPSDADFYRSLEPRIDNIARHMLAGNLAPLATLSTQLDERYSQVQQRMRHHRLTYDVETGRLQRSRNFSEALGRLQIWIGALQQQEKAYLLNPDVEQGGRVRDRLRQLKLAVEDTLSGVRQPDKRQSLQNLITLLDRYGTVFAKIQAVIDSRQQADKDMTSAITAMQSLSSQASETRRQSLQNWQQLARQQMLWGMGVTLLASAALSLLLGRRLSRPILSMTRAISRVAAGEHQTNTPGLNRRDEIGQMAAAVEVFKQTLIETIDLQRKQAQENRARRLAEAEVRALNAQLEARVIERTEQLQKANDELEQTLAQLTQAQQQLVESEKMAALSGLVAGVAHELNTPLGNSITAISLLEEQLKEIGNAFSQGTLSRGQMEEYVGNGRDAFRLAGDNLQRAAKLIRTFKQLALEEDEGQPVRYNPSRIIEDTFTSLNRRIEQAGHRVSYRCEEGVEAVGHPSDLFQILSQLVDNTLTHAYPSGRSGTIVAELQSRGDGFRIRYADDGCGMDESQRQKVFEPFYTTGRGQGCTGLGMHMVYNLITQRMGGQISCHSEPERGCEFIIDLPRDASLSLPGSAVAS